MKDERILSICIPSYNRFGELKKLLDSIEIAKSREFNVFIVDNGSNDDIFTIANYDERFKFIKRENIVPGPVSIRTSLDYGNAKYVMLCLDKDFIKGEYIDIFIEALKESEEINCGYCELNSSLENGQIIINEHSIERRIYRCGHPSGYFFKKEIVEEATRKLNPMDVSDPLYNNPFMTDLVYAYGLVDGKEGIYNGMLIVPETLNKASETKSYTYTVNNKNIYFMPECKRRQMILFVGHLDTLNIDKKKKKAITERLFRKTMVDCTIGYMNIMSNKQICSHHSLTCQKISFCQMLKEAIILSNQFMAYESLLYGKLFKVKAILLSWIVFFLKVFFGKLGGQFI